MTVDDIKSSVCKWITNGGESAVKMPSNTSAYNGKYYAVDVTNVSQYGTTTTPPPSENESHKRVAQYVATVVIHEVGGDGEKLRKFRNDFVSDEFLEFVRKRFEKNDGLDRAFSVWDVNDIEELMLNDGGFFINQHVLSFRVQFNDFIDYYGKKILSVSGTVGPDEMDIERS